MSTQVLLLVAGWLLTSVGAVGGSAPDTASAFAASGQYCFPNWGTAFPAPDASPEITLIYGGVTLSATPTAFSQCDLQTTATPAPTSTTESSGASSDHSERPEAEPSAGPMQSRLTVSSSTVPLQTSAQQDPGAASSFGIVSTSLASPMHSLVASSTLDASSTLVADLGSGTHRTTAVSAGNSMTMATDTPSTISTRQSVAGGIPEGPSSALSVSSALTIQAPSYVQPIGTFSGNSPASSQAPTVSTLPVDLPTPTSASVSEDPNAQNATIELSQAAVEALQLAQYLKNLGVFVFNSSNWFANGGKAPQSLGFASLADSVANISTVGVPGHRGEKPRPLTINTARSHTTEGYQSNAQTLRQSRRALLSVLASQQCFGYGSAHEHPQIC